MGWASRCPRICISVHLILPQVSIRLIIPALPNFRYTRRPTKIAQFTVLKMMLFVCKFPSRDFHCPASQYTQGLQRWYFDVCIKNAVNGLKSKHYFCSILVSIGQTFSSILGCAAAIGCMPSACIKSGLPATPFKKNGTNLSACFLANSA